MRTGVDLWLHRLAVLLFVLLCAGTGVMLIIFPWSLQWSDNYLLLRFPALQPIVTNGFVRGVCSGLGLLDLWIGFAEAVHYHEEKPAQK
jgi:phage shock protein PspC (stress-responsive transcriptional regulator)